MRCSLAVSCLILSLPYLLSWRRNVLIPHILTTLARESSRRTTLEHSRRLVRISLSLSMDWCVGTVRIPRRRSRLAVWVGLLVLHWRWGRFVCSCSARGRVAFACCSRGNRRRGVVLVVVWIGHDNVAQHCERLRVSWLFIQ